MLLTGYIFSYDILLFSSKFKILHRSGEMYANFSNIVPIYKTVSSQK